MLFDVRVVAFDPHGSEDPASALVRVFGVDRAIAVQVVQRLPRVIKRGVPAEVAQRFAEVLHKIGAHAELVLSTETPASTRGRDSRATHAPTEPRVMRTVAGLPAPNPAAVSPSLREAPANSNAAGPRARSRAVTQAAVKGGPAAALHEPRGRATHEEASLVLPELVAGDRAESPSRKSRVNDGRPSLELPTARKATRLPTMAEPEPLEADFDRPTHAPMPASAPRMRTQVSPHAQASAQASSPSAREADELRVSFAQISRSSMANIGLRVEETAAPTFAVTRPATLGLAALPALVVHGPAVDAASSAVPTRAYVLRAGWTAGVLGACLSLLSLGALPLLLVSLLVLDYLRRRRAVRQLQTAALPVGQSQLPEIYTCVKQFALRLGLKQVPRVYVIARQGVAQTSFVFRAELFLVLDEDMLMRHLERGEGHVVSFVMAHEIARYALGQLRPQHRALSWLYPMLRRLDLLGADAVAVQLMIDRAQARSALLAMLAGPRLAPMLDMQELDRQATSHERERIVHVASPHAASSMLLARIYHMQRGYTGAHELTQPGLGA